MSIILGLLIFVLGLYFLSLFFQVARLEKVMVESVTLLERYMILKHSLGDKKADTEDGDAKPETETPAKPA